MPSVSAEFRAWHEFDWRFLLPDPTVARVWLDTESDEERATLTAAGIAVSDRTTAAGVDVALVNGRAFDARSLENALPPDTLVRLTITASPSPLALRPWTTRRKELQARGWKVLGCFWVNPAMSRARGYADIADANAVRCLLLMTQPRRSVRGRLKAGAALAATRVGLTEVMCREGIILARTPE